MRARHRRRLFRNTPGSRRLDHPDAFNKLTFLVFFSSAAFIGLHAHPVELHKPQSMNHKALRGVAGSYQEEPVRHEIFSQTPQHQRRGLRTAVVRHLAPDEPYAYSDEDVWVMETHQAATTATVGITRHHLCKFIKNRRKPVGARHSPFLGLNYDFSVWQGRLLVVLPG